MENACLKARTLIILWFGVILGVGYLLKISFCSIVRDISFTDNCSIFIATLEITVFSQISFLGLYGFHTKKPFYLKLYVLASILTITFWLTVIAIVTSTFGNYLQSLDKIKQITLDGSYLARISHTTANEAYIWKTCFFLVLWNWIKSYFTRVIHRYYLDLKEEVRTSPPTYCVIECNTPPKHTKAKEKIDRY